MGGPLSTAVDLNRRCPGYELSCEERMGAAKRMTAKGATEIGLLLPRNVAYSVDIDVSEQ